jgi:hypothetical protein
MYNGYMAQAKYNSVQTNFINVSDNVQILVFNCELDGLMTLLVNGGGTRKHICKNQNTNSFASLFIDHYHYQGFINPITGYSATWWFGTPVGASLNNKDGYILFDGNPTNQCLVKITSTVLNPETNIIETFKKNISMRGLLSQC